MRTMRESQSRARALSRLLTYHKSADPSVYEQQGCSDTHGAQDQALSCVSHPGSSKTLGSPAMSGLLEQSLKLTHRPCTEHCGLVGHEARGDLGTPLPVTLRREREHSSSQVVSMASGAREAPRLILARASNSSSKQ